MTDSQKPVPKLDFPVVDAHLHLFTAAWQNRIESFYSGGDVELEAAARKRRELHAKQIGTTEIQPLEEPMEEAAKIWLKEFDDNGVAAGVFLLTDPSPPEWPEFRRQAPDRFIGFSWVDPTGEDAAGRLRREILEFGTRGLKLYTPLIKMHAWDERLIPIYELASEFNLPILAHFGITVSYYGDMRYANPLDLQTVARDFPDVNFILAHFGTGFLRETLLLCHSCPNVSVDTSSSNVWVEMQAANITRTDVYRKFLDLAGPERIFFGTDSSYFPRGYRRTLLLQCLEILDELNVPEAGRAAIMGGNMIRVLEGVKIEMRGVSR